MRSTLVDYLKWRDGLPDLAGVDSDLAWKLFRGAHDDRCAICRKPSKLVVDHDHRTGLIRGLLCRSCNGRATVNVHRSLASLHRVPPQVVLYCQWPPAAKVGVRRAYNAPYWDDPKPAISEALWHAGSDGLELEADRRAAVVVQMMSGRSW